ncbi:WD repeat protein 35 like protein, partial [Aduncisulcus paluster]
MLAYLNKKVPFLNSAHGWCTAYNTSHSLLAYGGDQGLLDVVKMTTKRTGDYRIMGVAAQTDLPVKESLAGHSKRVCLIKWNPKRLVFLSADISGTAIIWKIDEEDFTNISKLQTRGSDGVALVDAAWSPNGMQCATIYADDSLILSTVNGTLVSERTLDGEVQSICWTPNGKRLVVCCTNRIFLCDVTGAPKEEIIPDLELALQQSHQTSHPHAQVQHRPSVTSYFKGKENTVSTYTPVSSISYNVIQDSKRDETTDLSAALFSSSTATGQTEASSDGKTSDLPHIIVLLACGAVLFINMESLHEPQYRIVWTRVTAASGMSLSPCGRYLYICGGGAVQYGRGVSATRKESGVMEVLSITPVISSFSTFIDAMQGVCLLKCGVNHVTAISAAPSGLRVAMCIGKHLYFANIRHSQQYGRLNDNVVGYFHHSQEDSTLCLWNKVHRDMVPIVFGDGIHLCSFGEGVVCVVPRRLGGIFSDVSHKSVAPSSSGPVSKSSSSIPLTTLIHTPSVLCVINSIGVKIAEREISFTPTSLAVSEDYVAAACGGWVCIWCYKEDSKVQKIKEISSHRDHSGPGGFDATSILSSRSTFAQWHIEGDSADEMALLTRGSGQNPITSLCIRGKVLCVARESGEIKICVVVEEKEDSTQDLELTKNGKTLNIQQIFGFDEGEKKSKDAPPTSAVSKDVNPRSSSESRSAIQKVNGDNGSPMTSLLPLSSFRVSSIISSSSLIKAVFMSLTGRLLLILDRENILTMYERKDSKTFSKVPSFQRKEVWCVHFSHDCDDLFAVNEKTRLYTYRHTSPEEPVVCSGYALHLEALQTSVLLLDEIMKFPFYPDSESIVILEGKSLRDTKELLKSVSLEDTVSFVQSNPHPLLWNLVAEESMKKLNLIMAEKAFAHAKNFFGLQFVRKLEPLSSLPSKGKLKAEIAVYFGEFEDAERIFIDQLHRPDLAVALRGKLGDYFSIVQYSKRYKGVISDDTLRIANENIARYFIERRKFKRALQYAKKGNSPVQLAIVYSELGYFEDLRNHIGEIPYDAPLEDVIEIVQVLRRSGLTKEADLLEGKVRVRKMKKEEQEATGESDDSHASRGSSASSLSSILSTALSLYQKNNVAHAFRLMLSSHLHGPAVTLALRHAQSLLSAGKVSEAKQTTVLALNIQGTLQMETMGAHKGRMSVFDKMLEDDDDDDLVPSARVSRIRGPDRIGERLTASEGLSSHTSPRTFGSSESNASLLPSLPSDISPQHLT